MDNGFGCCRIVARDKGTFSKIDDGFNKASNRATGVSITIANASSSSVAVCTRSFPPLKGLRIIHLNHL